LTQAIRQRATEGVVFLILQSVVSRIAILGSQIALGYLLSPKAFGISGIAQMIITVAWTMIGFGVDSVYIQRNTKMPYWEKSAFLVTVGQGIVAGLLLIAASPICATVFRTPELGFVMVLVGLSMPVVASSVVPGAKIYAALQFKWNAGYNVVELMATQALIVGFAFLKMGSYAFFLPIPIMFALRAIVYWRRAPVDLKGRFRPIQSIILLRRGALIFAARVFLTLVDQGDYLVLGLFASSQSVGFYFFAFRLAAMPVRVIATSLQGVLFSVLSKLNDEKSRQTSAALRSAEILSYISTPICIIQIAVAPAIFHIIFGQKWNESILLFQVLSLGLPAEAIASVARARLSAAGEFRRLLVYSGISAAIFFAMVVVGALTQQALGVACAVSAFYAIVQTVLFFRVFPPETDQMRHLGRIFLWPLGFSCIASVIGAAAGLAMAPIGNEIVQIFFIGGVASGLFILLVWRLQRRIFDEIANIGLSILRRDRPA
jgi:PST family polysaccharide transporter